MAITLNHTIVPAQDKHASAAFLVKILDLSFGVPFGPFVPVRINETTSLDYANNSELTRMNAAEIIPQHYAFKVDDAEFDAIFGRIREAGLSYGSQPWSLGDMKVDTSGSGRTVYFFDLANHVLEIRTAKPGSM